MKLHVLFLPILQIKSFQHKQLEFLDQTEQLNKVESCTNRLPTM